MSARCALCGGILAVHWAALRVMRCGGCGLLTRHPLPTQAQLAELYRRAWTRPEASLDETGGTDLALGRTYSRKLAQDLGMEDFGGLKLLDFGAGGGAMAQALSELGAEVYAVEPFGYAQLALRGVRAFASIEEVPAQVCFDGAVAIDVVEHLPTPWVELRHIKERLSPGGWLYLATPNAAGLNARINGARWREARKEAHLLFLTPRALERILREAGFGRWRRLHWLVRYKGRWAVRCWRPVLQLLGWDGELR